MGQLNWLVAKNKNKNRTWEAPHLINRRGEFGDLRRKKLVEIWRFQWIFFHENSLYEQHCIFWSPNDKLFFPNKKCNIHCILTLVLKM
jgi:hypothetical protein